MSAELSIQQEVVSLIPALQKFAWRFHRSQTDVDDLVQETLLKALRALPSFTPGTSLKSWMFTIMRNAHHTAYQKSRRVTVGTNNMEHLIPAASSPQEWAIRKIEYDRALAAMPPVYRHVFHLVIEDGQAYDAAASECQISVGTVKSRVNRAKHFLANHMGDTMSTVAAI
ncbi:MULTISPECIES: RNA polymerase sigma factor [Agrobacterium]|uniref:Putative RNA polymerase sigma-C factor n=1 Tax=Agrobacterium rosae TaxID=1972867 RepID=A0A1R3TBK3_9HYPH|nr:MULTISPECIES: RNA polymerase sigma factor [Agrobacterium]KAA3515436.1 RNA polymerase sigma factor [Agrobacterium rosae]KAA3524402.1 RNA polymerase sigma factor [Agrobacterium rosae]MBN7804302.1 RNA polymerase sigma factor [Agrobacterium rosae]MCM2431305.1 RNA polymerase sigma factor [Agrobacterium rosae]MDX8302267.1 RNA polymerase sigma factor [Agrobacterium rosae]